MLQERDVLALSPMLEHFLESTLSDPETSEFSAYFKDNYLNNVESWAYCHRLKSGLNTNMHIERMHRTIKYIYFNGRKVKRLDKAITQILKFVRDKLFDRLITINKGKLCSKLKELRLRHKTSEKLDINQITKNGVYWEIPSSSSSSSYEVYTIEENDINNHLDMHRFMHQMEYVQTYTFVRKASQRKGSVTTKCYNYNR
jgi:hypothetical protein